MNPNVTVNHGSAVIQEVVWLDHLSTGGDVYMASDPRLPGCLSHGATVDEASFNLEYARIAYIDSMVLDGLDIPEWWIREWEDV